MASSSARRGNPLNQAQETALVASSQTPSSNVKRKSGRAVNLLTNHFQMRIDLKEIFQYDVKFEPEVESRGLRQGLLNDHLDLLGENFILDGGVLFLQKYIGDAHFTSKSKNNGKLFTIRVAYIAEISKKSDVVFQLYNILLRRMMRQRGLQQLGGRNYFDPSRKREFEKFRFEIWPGFQTALNLNEGGIMLNAGLTFKVLRTHNCLDIIRETKGSQSQKRDLLVHQIVFTKHNNKTHRIDDVSFEMSPCSTFKRHNEEEPISFVEYYSRMYNITIQDRKQPMLVVKQKKRRQESEEVIYIPPELAIMTGITDEMRSNFQVMREMHNVTRVQPMERIKELENFVSELANPKDTQLKSALSHWAMKMDPKMLKVEGRTLDPQEVMFNKPIKASPRGDWPNFAKEAGLRFRSPVMLDRWLLVYNEKDEHAADDLIYSFHKVGEPLGIKIGKPKEVIVDKETAEAFQRSLQQHVHKDYQLVCVILPTPRADRYAAVKSTLVTEVPVPSQCVVARTLSDRKKLLSIATKIMQQITVKMGGHIWSLNFPFTTPTMIVGIDVCHDKKANGSSVAGICASLDKNFSAYYSRVCFNPPGNELSDALGKCLQEAVKVFFRRNKTLPERIIVYRDGVGDGQLDAVQDYELPQMKNAFTQFPNYHPKMTVIIVKKRINTRLFTTEASNPAPGTLVDTIIVKHHSTFKKNVTQYDFFLVSQHVGQGTVSPTHYHVIFDESGLIPDYMQQLTYKLCHMYYNWPGTISIPAPCQYAHKVAFLIGQSVHRQHHEELNEKLFFL